MRTTWGLALAVCAGCSWTLPEPDVRDTGVRDVGADARRDVGPIDATVQKDAPDVVSADRGLVDLGGDRGAVDAPVVMDLGADVGRIDAGFDVGADRGAVGDLGVTDVAVDRGADVAADVAADVRVDAGVVTCTPGERRTCYPGPPASRGRGYCRDGFETCDAGGRWGGACVNAVVPDCTGRACGSDDCGGTCGAPCVAGQVCDEAGRCVIPSCGASSFIIACDEGVVCPANSVCTADNLCSCQSGYVARTCAGVDCGLSCTYPDWYCARAGFCAGGAVACVGGFTCPRHAVCNESARSCVCAPGYMAVTCGGDRCTACPGTDYRCVPAT
jgi:hypothetical protein